jgi:hypothetical protein
MLPSSPDGEQTLPLYLCAVCIVLTPPLLKRISFRNNKYNAKLCRSSLILRVFGLSTLSSPTTLTTTRIQLHGHLSPCRVNGNTFNATDASAADAGTTNLTLYDFTSSPPVAHNVSLPEQCIYRYDPEFVRVISQIMQDEIFDGYCTVCKGLTCTKTRSASQSYDGEIPGLGVSTVLQTLFDEKDPAKTNVTL